MEELHFKKKNDRVAYQDCVAYLLQLYEHFKKDAPMPLLCYDIAEKALFLYNISPKSFGRSKAERQIWLDAINRRMEEYASVKEEMIKKK